MPLWAKIYWVVAIALFGVWVWRRISGRGSDSKPRVDAGDSAPPAASSIHRPDPSGHDPLSDPSQRVWPAPPPPDPDDDTYRATDTYQSTDTSSQPSGEAGGAGIGDRPPLGNQPGNSPRPTATLPDLLAGVTLPHELVPLTQVGVAIDLATHVVVATRKAPYEVVATGLTAELERLGYEVDRGSMTELTARGERGVVRVVIHPDGANVHDAGIRRFPTAEEHAVVVELFAG